MSDNALLGLLRSHATGELELSSTQLKAIELLLKAEPVEPNQVRLIITGVPRRGDPSEANDHD